MLCAVSVCDQALKVCEHNGSLDKKDNTGVNTILNTGLNTRVITGDNT